MMLLHIFAASLGRQVKIHDVQYRSIKDDPIVVARDIYRHLGLEFSPVVEQAMRNWEARESAYGSFGHYSYTLEQYGLTREIIDSAFSEYNRRFLQPA